MALSGEVVEIFRSEGPAKVWICSAEMRAPPWDDPGSRALTLEMVVGPRRRVKDPRKEILSIRFQKDLVGEPLLVLADVEGTLTAVRAARLDSVAAPGPTTPIL